MNINLIGMRGAGKTNVARRLSLMSRLPTLSTDTLIEYEAGRTITELIAAADGGWRQFRELEYAVVTKVCRLDGIIVDCGGGVIVDLDESGAEVLSTRKVDALRSRGPIIWLRGDIAALAAKADASRASRPALSTQRSTEELMRLREPFYEAAADVVLPISPGRRQAVARQIYLRYLAPTAMSDSG